MRIAYDKESHGLVVEFGNGKSYATSREVAPGIVVDFDRADQPIALELEDVRGILDEKDIESITAPAIARGADLAKFRAHLGLTQERLAEILEVPRNTIARWERDELAIEKSRMLALALASIAGGSRRKSTIPMPARRSHSGKAIPEATRPQQSRGGITVGTAHGRIPGRSSAGSASTKRPKTSASDHSRSAHVGHKTSKKK